jgi:hypothetical protein
VFLPFFPLDSIPQPRLREKSSLRGDRLVHKGMLVLVKMLRLGDLREL